MIITMGMTTMMSSSTKQTAVITLSMFRRLRPSTAASSALTPPIFFMA